MTHYVTDRSRNAKGQFAPGSVSSDVLYERFWSYVDKRGVDECWPWTKTCNDGGHGQFWDGTRLIGAHRFAVLVTIAQGKIPKGFHVRHSCDNPPCCNPNHLLLGTQQDNTNDMLQRHGHCGVARTNRAKTHCPAGHEYDRIDDKGHRWCRKCHRVATLKHMRKLRALHR